MKLELPILKEKAESIFEQKRQERFLRQQAIWQHKDYHLGYKSVFMLVKDTLQTHRLIQEHDILSELTYGRAAGDQLKAAEKFYQKFQDNKSEWKIISDLTSLFTGLPFERNFTIDTNIPFNIDLELSYHIMWKLGQEYDGLQELINKVQRYCILMPQKDLALYTCMQRRLKSKYKDVWQIKTIPKHQVSSIDQEISVNNLNSMSQLEILNGQFLHIYNFLILLISEMEQETALVNGSQYMQLQMQVEKMERRVFHVNRLLDPNATFQRLRVKPVIAKVQAPVKVQSKVQAPVKNKAILKGNTSKQKAIK